ncbi:MAG: hypothetical protein ACLPKB_24535 [Xanthobacteraceae bacterium]
MALSPLSIVTAVHRRHPSVRLTTVNTCVPMGGRHRRGSAGRDGARTDRLEAAGCGISKGEEPGQAALRNGSLLVDFRTMTAQNSLCQSPGCCCVILAAIRRLKYQGKTSKEEVINRRILTFALASFGLLLGVSFAIAQQSGTAAEVKAMFDRAIAALKANEAAALAAFNDKNNKD